MLKRKKSKINLINKILIDIIYNILIKIFIIKIHFVTHILHTE